MLPDTHYARSGDVHIAYEVLGDGPINVVLRPDGFIPMEVMFDEPSLAGFLRRLATFSRVIRFDPRGAGLSDPVTSASPPTLEQWVDDALAVLDHIGVGRAAFLGMAEGGFMTTLLAATHPERASALVLVNATPGVRATYVTPRGTAAEFLERLAESVERDWGGDMSGIPHFAPGRATDEHYRAWLAKAARRAASPATAKAMFNVAFYSDIGNILASVQVPTLIVHRTGNRWLPPSHGQYLAEHIPGARYVEVPGDDHVPYLGDADTILDEIEAFLTGTRRTPMADRVLATVSFTDIVGSTEQAARLGDRAWRQLLDAHDTLVRQHLERFRGREIKTTGDGFLCTFDGPARGIACACAVRDATARLGVMIRVGLHTGECDIRGDDISGIAVHTAQRVQAIAAPGEVLVSSTVKDLVAGSGITFTDRGAHALKGVPDEWRLFAVEQ